ncbi:MAG: hypothetical protein PF485_03315 [Bacteroidales bacterium]|jgi:predicted transcriptional regulator|nr:hypothetical protein [Bacteroidales bacterium]
MIEKEQNLNQIKESLENPINQRIIQHLNNNGRLNFGSIIKNLGLSPKIGTLHIIKLKNLGLISYVNKTGLLELDQELLQSLKS